MLTGVISAEGEPSLEIEVAGRPWTAILDTGFNGDLELPERLRQALHPRFLGFSASELAGGQRIIEEVYEVAFPFDGRTVQAQATFVPGDTILLGTNLLLQHRLIVHFPGRWLYLERVT